ncbi:DUF2069 domain-containing protein [Dokdonella sp.]|uniref:DUF2069 domain-containing protein n=1 Tax=Dokdonella sp. TaxID=2291710 RepID=UPI0031C17C2C|nr:DUF2069 domain-containing protein [Dokdonella sp.]
MSAHTLGLASWLALVLLQPAWYLWLAPPTRPGLALALMLPPLLLPLLALRSGTRRMLLWAGMLALFYFCHGLVAAWVTPAARVPALVEAVLCALLIASLGLASRRPATVAR